VAANLRAMEAEVEIVGVVGDDSTAALVGMLQEIGVETDGCCPIPRGRPPRRRA
jgi:bifunctional ADP-heptose synthase (sugar kinase/adenylyltransferase)